MLPIPVFLQTDHRSGTTEVEMLAQSPLPVEIWISQHLMMIDYALSFGGILKSEQPRIKLPENSVWCVVRFNSMREVINFLDSLKNR